MSLLEDVEQVLRTNGVVNSTWLCFKGHLPSTPDRAVVVAGTGGEPPDQSNLSIDFPTFQVRVRGERFKYQETLARAVLAYRALHNVQLYDHDTSPATPYVYCFAQQSGPLPMGLDPSERPVFALNFRCMKPRV